MIVRIDGSLTATSYVEVTSKDKPAPAEEMSSADSKCGGSLMWKGGSGLSTIETASVFGRNAQPWNAIMCPAKRDAAIDASWIARNYGVLVPTSRLATLLGFPSGAALRQAKATGRLEIRLFPVRGRRGLFASAEDVGEYLRAHAPGPAKGDPMS